MATTMSVRARVEKEVESESAAATQAWGAALAGQLEPGDVIALQGDLGAGKTNFAQGLARGLSITEDVNSPTFILANEYSGGRLPLYHIDAYRLENADEARGFGLDDYLNGDGVTVVEWAERVRDALPQDTLWIEFKYLGENERRLTFRASGVRGVKILEGLEHAARD